MSAVCGCNRTGNLHGSDVFGSPAAYLERLEMAETGECGDGLFRVERGCEGEGEGMKTGAGIEEGEDGVGGGSPCGTFRANGEGSDVCAVVCGDMADKGVERRSRGEGYVGEDRGETEGADGGGGGGECADGVVGEEENDGEVELCGEDVPGHWWAMRTVRVRGYLYARLSFSSGCPLRSDSQGDCVPTPTQARITLPYHPGVFRPTRHLSVQPGTAQIQSPISFITSRLRSSMQSLAVPQSGSRPCASHKSDLITITQQYTTTRYHRVSSTHYGSCLACCPRCCLCVLCRCHSRVHLLAVLPADAGRRGSVATSLA
jgi:hypothetical protein